MTDAELDTREPGTLDAYESDSDTSKLAVLRPSKAVRSVAIIATALFVTVAVAVAAWFAVAAHRMALDDSRDRAFVDAARRGALSLTSIDYNTVEADIKDILDSSTGAFLNEFEERAEMFSDFVKQARSVSRSTLIQAGIESDNGTDAIVLVALSVTTSAGDVPENKPRAWRMRITVKEVDHHEMKMSNVEFVP